MSSVDGGEELLWEDDSKYNDALGWATGKWYQRSGALSLIRIAPDHVTAVNDVEWRDWSKNSSALGTWEQKNGIDHIYFNKKRLDKAPFNTRDARRAVAVHEPGTHSGCATEQRTCCPSCGPTSRAGPRSRPPPAWTRPTTNASGAET
ncbi:hypothetical protein AB0L68_41175 [Streptomyces sp. NPDC052164]|uniref:hypothetical protein n=1 Tax=Streptomyces sp. NPDC052164 TaxID=3155529 RepID=UPI003447D3C7